MIVKRFKRIPAELRDWRGFGTFLEAKVKMGSSLRSDWAILCA